MAGKSITIKFTDREVAIIERYKAGRPLAFGAAVKELIHVADGALNDKAMSTDFADFISLQKKLSIESLLLLRHFIHKADPETYKRVKMELKDMLNDEKEG